jgi:membrane protein DedA with SNARE-associated domain
MLASTITLPAVPIFAYLVLCGIAAADLFVPVLPSGATMIAAGVVAATGHLSPVPVFAAGMLGASVGDLAGYRLGRGLAHTRGARRRALEPRHDTDRIERWERRFTRHGVLVLVAARYLPAGRTAAALGAGRLGVNGRHFLICAVVAEALWAGPAMLIGYAGGNLLPPDVVHIALAVMVSATITALAVVGVRRRLRKRAARRAPGDAEPAGSADRNTTTGS